MTSYEIRQELFKAVGFDLRTKMSVFDLINFEGFLMDDPEFVRRRPKFETTETYLGCPITNLDSIALVQSMTKEERAGVRARVGRRLGLL